MAKGHSVPSGALALILLAAPAYEHPLDAHSVREAYFLGQRNDSKTAAFMARYVKPLPVPKRGPHVSEIELRTPYALAVERSRLRTVGYSAQQAEQDYAATPDLILVRVYINLTPTYPGYAVGGKEGPRERPWDFWRDFKIMVRQGGTIAPKKLSGRPIYASAFQWAPPPLAGALQGAEVTLEFDASQVASAPLRVEVVTPDGETVGAEFDLRDLR